MKTKKFTRVPPEIPVSELSPLDITCGSTKCDDGFHCFSLAPSSKRKFGREGVCKECGTDLIDWSRIYKNDIQDAKFIFSSLKKELIRHVVWHHEVDKSALDKAAKLTRAQLKSKAVKQLKQRIGKKIAWDGRQTPICGDNIIDYAQHATATCCRRCLKAWHNIPENIELTDGQLDFFADLIMLYIDEKVPAIVREPVN